MDRRQVFQIGGPGWLARLVLALSWLVTLARSADASPPEIFSSLALHPTDASRLVLAYAGGGQGLLFSDDGGRHFRLRCGSAVGPAFTKSRLPLALTHDGQTLLGTFDGLLRGSADGCGFGVAPELPAGIVADFAADPLLGDVLYVAEGAGLSRRGRDGSLTALRERGAPDAGEATWLVDRVRVAALPGDGRRLYTSGLRAETDGSYTPVLRRSDDGGASWVTLELPVEDGARVLLVAVDPTNPERLALSLEREGARDALLIGSDAGATLELRLELHALGAVAVAPDGRLWVGDAGGDTEYSQPGGLYLLDDFGATARGLATWPVRCLGYRALDGTLLGCTRSDFGHVEPATGAFTALSAFQTVDAFVSCGDEDLVTACQRQLCDNWCGVLHYAEAPLCDVYHEVSPVCGPAARGYGSGPDAETPVSIPVAEGAVATPEAPAASVAAPTTVASGRGAARCSLGAQPDARHSCVVSAMLVGAAALRRLRRRRRALPRSDSYDSFAAHARGCDSQRALRHSRR